MKWFDILVAILCAMWCIVLGGIIYAVCEQVIIGGGLDVLQCGALFVLGLCIYTITRMFYALAGTDTEE